MVFLTTTPPPPSSSLRSPPVSDHYYNKQPAAEKAAAAKALARASARASARANSAAKRNQSEHSPASQAPAPKRRQLHPRGGQPSKHEIDPVLPSSDALRPEERVRPLPLPQQTCSSGPHIPVTSSTVPTSGPISAPPTLGPTVGPHEQVWRASITQPQYGLPTISQQAQYQADWAGAGRGIPTYQHGPRMDRTLATPAPTQLQPPMQWYPLSSRDEPGQAFMFDLGPRRYEEYETQTRNHYFPGLASGYIPYSGASSHLGAAACPIPLDDNVGTSVPGLLTAPKEQPLQMPPTYPVYYPPRSHESKENRGDKTVTNPPPRTQSLTIGHPLRPLFPSFNEASLQPPISSQSHPALGAQHHFDAMCYPFNYDYPSGSSLPISPLTQYPFTPTGAPPSIVAKPAETGVQGIKTPKLSSAMDEPPLCPEQAALVDLILQGHNVFYTGSAGCGKSTVLRAFVRRLKGMGKTVQILAPTGRAALNVGGSTTWTFAGWRPDSHKKPLQRLMDEASFGKNVSKRLRETDVLVIDEISMVENLHFERLNAIMKSARHNPSTTPRPFGGCQIIVTGDFCQLPPVKPFKHCIECGKELVEKTCPDNKLLYECRHHGIHADKDKWAFRSKAWEECGFKHVHLKTIHRQNDQVFIRMLQKCRLGDQLTESEMSLLMNHNARVSQAIKLFCTRKEADDVNRAAFDKIKAQKYLYWARDTFIWRQIDHPSLLRKGARSEWRNVWSDVPPKQEKPLQALDEHRFGECVQLKQGGLVVLLANLDLQAGLCNGSQGVVCGFEDYDAAMMPMREELALGIKFKRESKAAPKPGQRVLRGENAGTQEQEIRHFIASECVPVKKWPVVQFHNGLRRTVYGECSITQLGDDEPYSLLARTQLPLAPAWAMTVHKSQSLTLDRVIVNLDRVFEEGQVYVALSRATGLGGLKIEGDGRFLRDKLMVNAEVAAFLRGKFGEIYDPLEGEAPGGASVEEQPSSCSSLAARAVS